MDGTLTVAGCIDFKRLRHRLAIPPGEDILNFVAAAADAATAARRAAIVEEEEHLGLAKLALMPDISALVSFAASRPALRLGLLTRNNAAAAEHTLGKLREAGMRFDAALSREWAGGPPKPHPAALLHMAGEWGVAPGELCMVGDSLDDVACGAAAGATAVLIGEGDEPGARETAHHHVDSLTSLVALLQREFQ